MPSAVRVYFITWTTYGTWLHGEAKGSVDRDHTRPFSPVIPDLPARRARARRLLKSEPVVLSTGMRRTVDRAIREHAWHRGWRVHAINVRTNHVHLVCAASEVTPEQVMRESKAWATRALREAGMVDDGVRVWTRHGSTRYLRGDRSVARAIEYVREWQDDARRFGRGT